MGWVGVLLLCVWNVSSTSAQSLTYGAIVGSALTNDFSAASPNAITESSAARGFIMGGGTVEWNFLHRISVEADGIFRELHYNESPAGPRDPVVTWQFPILAKYYLPGRSPWLPFIEAGPSFRSAGNLNGTRPSAFGTTFGVGVNLQLQQINIVPTLRYTRWERDSQNFINTRPDQLELFVGFSHTSADIHRPFGSHVSFGATLGVNLLGDYYSSTLNASEIIINPDGSETPLATASVTRQGSRSLVIGPTIELHILGGLSLEGAALFHTVNSTTSFTSVLRPDLDASFPSSQVTWRFPVLAKYAIPLSFHSWQPFAEVGPSFRIPAAVSHFGLTIGIGASTHLGPIVISPAIRYTRWQSDPSGLKSDEGDLVIGARF